MLEEEAVLAELGDDVHEPVTQADVDEFGCEWDNMYMQLRAIFSRLRAQYGGDTWISNEVWKAICHMDEAGNILVELIENDAFLTPAQREMKLRRTG